MPCIDGGARIFDFTIDVEDELISICAADGLVGQHWLMIFNFASVLKIILVLEVSQDSLDPDINSLFKFVQVNAIVNFRLGCPALEDLR